MTYCSTHPTTQPGVDIMGTVFCPDCAAARQMAYEDLKAAQSIPTRPPTSCTCGGFKTYGAQRGQPGHSSWCDWA